MYDEETITPYVNLWDVLSALSFFFVLGCREKSNSQQVSAYFGLWNTECVKLANIAVSDWERMEL